MKDSSNEKDELFKAIDRWLEGKQTREDVILVQSHGIHVGSTKKWTIIRNFNTKNNNDELR
jgi:hypothetical protein